MAMLRLHMNEIREILRLRFDAKRSHREIATSVDCGRTSVGDCLRRFTVCGLTWPLPVGTTDESLESCLYPVPIDHGHSRHRPNWQYIHSELKKKSVTKMLLWHEYKGTHPDGYQYTQFCIYYREWTKSADLVFRNEHKAGEKVFIDYAGQTMPIWGAQTGECKHAQIFLGVPAEMNQVRQGTCLADEVSTGISTMTAPFCTKINTQFLKLQSVGVATYGVKSSAGALGPLAKIYHNKDCCACPEGSVTIGGHTLSDNQCADQCVKIIQK